MVKPGRKLKKIILIAGITGAVYGGFRYLLPLVVPFLFAYGTALWRKFDTPKPHKAHSVLFFCQFFKYCIA